jgi:hypothetical protein
MPVVDDVIFGQDPETLTPENYATALTPQTTISQRVTKKTSRNLHIDLISRISADHMEDSESTARVFVEPSIQLEGVSFVDDDDVTFVDRLLNGRRR